MCPGRVLQLAASQPHQPRFLCSLRLRGDVKADEIAGWTRWDLDRFILPSLFYFILIFLLPGAACLCIYRIASVSLRVSVCVPACVCVCFLPCSSSLLGSWSARGCKAVLVDSFRTKCVCDRLSTFAILARLNPEMVSPTKLTWLGWR